MSMIFTHIIFTLSSFVIAGLAVSCVMKIGMQWIVIILKHKGVGQLNRDWSAKFYKKIFQFPQ